MHQLKLPSFDIKLKKKEGKIFVLDSVRNKYVSLTPEEWVRQHFVNFMINHKGYPLSLMANEVTISLNNTTKRCDTVIYHKNLKPYMIVEYKAPDVKITSEVFDQIIRYNMTLKVKYLIVSNGMEHYCCKVDYENSSFEFMKDIPDYNSL